MLILVFGTIIFMLFGHTLFNSAFQMVSALGTVGLQTIPLASIDGLLKVVLMIAMVFGRLEIFPLMILIRGLFRR
jgi:Trk-type K+ transport system membrane component